MSLFVLIVFKFLKHFIAFSVYNYFTSLVKHIPRYFILSDTVSHRTVFLISFSYRSLLEIIDFCICILYLATLVLIVFSVAPSEFSIFKIMLSENRGGFASSSSMQMPFISYFLLLLWPWLELPVQCQIAVVRMDILSHGQKRWWVKWKPLVPEHGSKKWSTCTF